MDKYRYNENVAGQGHVDDKDGFREQSSDKALLNEVTGGTINMVLSPISTPRLSL